MQQERSRAKGAFLLTGTVDVNKVFTKSFTDHVSIIFHQIRKHDLVTSVGGLQCFDVNFL